MKKISNFILILLLVSFGWQSHGQGNKNKRDKKVTIKIVTEENGNKTVLDTTFLNADQAEIDDFFANQKIDKKRAPLPPTPPLTPLPPSGQLPPLPPLPPTPPLDEKGFQSFNYQFEMPDVDIDFDIDEEMERAQKSLEIAKESMERGLTDSRIQFKEMEIIINEKVKIEVEREMRKLKNDLKDNDYRHKELIIKKRKVGENKKGFDDDNTGYNFENDGRKLKYVYTTSCAENGEPIIYNSSFSGNDMDGSMKIYTYSSEKKVSHSKFRRFMKRISEKILD